MKNSLTFYLCFVFLLLSNTSVFAQDCDNALYEANQLYVAGKIYDAIDVLRPCAPSMGPDEKFEALKLLAIASHDLDEIEDMDYYIEQMLELRPDYQNYPNNDPASFTKELEKYQVSPKVYASLIVGTNINNIKLIQSYATNHYPQAYHSTFGYQFGFAGSLNFTQTLSVGANLMFSGSSVNQEIQYENIWEQSYNEILRFTQFNLNAKKYFPITNSIDLYAGLSGGVAFLTKSKVYVESRDIRNENRKQTTRDGKDYRNKMQPNAGLLLGLSFDLTRGSVGIGAGYHLFSNTLADEDQRLTDDSFIFGSEHIDDELKLRLFSINVSYKMPLTYDLKRNQE